MTSKRRAAACLAIAAVLTTTGPVSSAAATAPPGVPPDKSAPSPPPTVPDGSHQPIDITRLEEGAPSRVPWLADGSIHAGQTVTPVDAEDVVSFSAIAGGYVVHSSTEAAASTDLVRPNGRTINLDEGDISAPIVRGGGKEIAWTRYDAANGEISSQVVAAYAPSGNVDPTTSGPVAAARYEPVGFLGALGVALDSEGDAPANAVDIASLSHLSWADTIGVSATSDNARLAAFVRRYDSGGRPCTTTARVDDLFGETEDLWESCQVMPISFSPNGRYAVAIDARADGLGYSALYVVRADTGKPIAKLTVGLSQRVAWESNKTLIFDAWSYGGMALVRCPLSGADCERTTPIAVDDPTDAIAPAYLLADR